MTRGQIFVLDLEFFLHLLVAGMAIGISIYKPYHNWDMIGYIAAAKSFEEDNIFEIHSFTYENVKMSVSEDRFTQLISGHFRYVMFTDPLSFEEVLTFYQIRPLYNILIYALFKIGVPIAFATHFVSAVAVFFALIILYFLSRSFLPKPFRLFIPLWAVGFGVFDLARYSTPDGLAFFAYILSTYL